MDARRLPVIGGLLRFIWDVGLLVVSNWAAIVQYVSAAGVMTLLAAWSATFKDDPVWWGAFALAAMIAVGLIRLLIRMGVRYGLQNDWFRDVRDKHPSVNPLETDFRNKRIFLNDFVLPTHPNVKGKNFVRCEFIGPANILFVNNNDAKETKPPVVDAVFLSDDSQIKSNCYFFTDCTFLECSFQRVTVFVHKNDYETHKDYPWLNWVSLTPCTGGDDPAATERRDG